MPAAAVTILVDKSRTFHSDMAALGAIALQPASSPSTRRPVTARTRVPRHGSGPRSLQCPRKHFHLHPVRQLDDGEIGLRFGLRAARSTSSPRGATGRAADTPAAAMTLPSCADAVAPPVRYPIVFGLRWSGRMTRGASRDSPFAICRTASTKSMFILPSAGTSGAAAGYPLSRGVRRAHGSRHCRGLPQFFAEAGWIRGFAVDSEDPYVPDPARSLHAAMAAVCATRHRHQNPRQSLEPSGSLSRSTSSTT